MSDSQWSLLVGAAIVIVTRLVDVFLPKGYISKLTAKYLTKAPKEPDPDEE